MIKRFYSDVAVERADTAGWQVTLDGRPLKTVRGASQIVPTEELARALAAEWDAQGEMIDTRTLQLRDMVDYAIDMVAPAHDVVVDQVVAYGDTDTLLYRADPDEPLYARQLEVWEPIVTAFEREHHVELVRISGVMHRAQPDDTLDRLREIAASRSALALAGIEAMAGLAASLVIALSASNPEADGEQLWQAASLEEEWQAELWGRDEEAEARREKRRSDFLKARELVLLAREA